MLNEFYKYIADSIVGFFQERIQIIHPGDRYCLRLDTAEMVSGVDNALRKRTEIDQIQGEYQYNDVYNTFTIKLSSAIEIVIASKINGMTDDFLATLRNAEHTEKHFPILMITHSPIDTITSGTGDLSAKGMPFHAESIVNKIKNEIKTAELSDADRILLELELEIKQRDRFSDKSSLFEYSDLLTVLGRGYVIDSDYARFSLLADDRLPSVPREKIRDRINENHRIFDRIDHVFKHGNIENDLDKEYDTPFIRHLIESKKKGTPWYENYTFEMVNSSHDKLRRKLDNPLCIKDEDINAYSGSAIEYNFPTDSLLFIRNDGEKGAKQRKKNILIFNPDQRSSVTLRIISNISVRGSWVDCRGATETCSGREILIEMSVNGCSFSRTEIKDPNSNISYRIKVCVLNLSPNYLENIITCYYLDVPKGNTTRSSIHAMGLKRELVINPGQPKTINANVHSDTTYDCNYDQSLVLNLDEEAFEIETGTISIKVKCGAVTIPLRIKDEPVKPNELTGIKALKKKHSEKRGIEYRNGKIILGTKEYFAKSPFKDSLSLEKTIVDNGWLAVHDTINGFEEYELKVSDFVRNSYSELISEYKRLRQLPSLAYLSGKLKSLAEQYICSVEEALGNLPVGQDLSDSQNDLLLLGAVIQTSGERTIKFSPLHPLNILYQLMLIGEEQVGEIRDDLVEKLTSLNLLPYIKDSGKRLYFAVEQRHSPEWHTYARITNKRFQGARNFVQKLVCEKITQYIDHFTFLFDDIGNDKLYINLINMGDCREVLQGLIRYYSKELHEENDPECLMRFVLNIYGESGSYNEFSVLSDQKRLKDYLTTYGKNVDDISEMALILSSRIKCFYRSSMEEKYQYAHLTFYEMDSSDNDGDSRMDSIATGVSLGGLISGTPSVLNSRWYKTGFGTKYATDNRLINMAKRYNALSRVAFSGSSYEPESAIFTEVSNSGEGQLNKIYDSSNWVVFIDPKVDLSFFKSSNLDDQDLMIIHYSDQYTSASGYDDITVTRKSEQYEEIIQDQLKQKGVTASKQNVHDIISLFNAFNGAWMLRLISAKKLAGAVDSYFSREKMSILSAIKLCMAYYAHDDIVWVPISLEEMLRVSGGAGYSQKDSLLSAKNLNFEKGVTSDDVLLIGIEGPVEDLKLYLHPVEVKIGHNPSGVIAKAYEQVRRTYNGFWKALWPENGRNALECKLSRNFLMQLVIVSCEKLQLYDVYPNETWDKVTDEYREALLNERYRFSSALDEMIGKGTVVSFKTDALNKSGQINDDVCLLELPEKMGSEYMIKSAAEIEADLDRSQRDMPDRIKYIYHSSGVDRIPRQNIETDNSTIQTKVEDQSIARDKEHSIKRRIETLSPVDVDFVETREDETSKQSEEESEKRKGMQILFGTDISNGKTLYWHPNDTNRVFHTNTGIIGTMGTGKTQFTKSLITQLHRDQIHNYDGYPLGILIFDYKGDYNEGKEDFVSATDAKVIKPFHLPFNPLSLTRSSIFKPLLPIHTANSFKDTLSKVYGLGAKQQNTLFSCITQAYAAQGIIPHDSSTWDRTPPTFEMVYKIYSENEDIKKNDSLAAAMEKLHQFQIFESEPDQTVTLFDLLNGVVVIDLSGYDSDIQSLIVAITLDLFYSQMQAAGSSKMDHRYRQLTKMILVDEADNFMSEGFPALKKILKEGREFGVGVILSTQFLKHFGASDDDYAKYIMTWVVHNVADLKQSDIEFVFKTGSKSDETQRLFDDIKKLEIHHSIVKIGTSKPCYIRDKAFWELYNEL